MTVKLTPDNKISPIWVSQGLERKKVKHNEIMYS